MKRSVLLTGLCTVGFFLIAWRSPRWPQGTPEKTQARQNEIEGVWTEVCQEMDGKLMSMLPMVGPAHLNFPGPNVVRLWKISKKKIEIGPENHLFPQGQYTYELNPGNKAGAIDLIRLDKIEKEKWRAIYFLKDDYLICVGVYGISRPETFTTSEKPPTTLYILRRGNLKNQFPR